MKWCVCRKMSARALSLKGDHTPLDLIQGRRSQPTKRSIPVRCPSDAMKFLHVISSMNPRSGGPCQGIRNLAPFILAQGHSSEVVCLDDPKSDYLAHEK